MAESDATPTTPADDGRARVNTNGTVDVPGGRKAFVWCQDEATGHRFDVPARALPRKGVRVVEGYPLNFTRFGRPSKTRHEWESAGEDDLPPVQVAVAGVSTGEQVNAPAAAGVSTSGEAAQGASVSDGGTGENAVAAPKNRRA